MTRQERVLARAVEAGAFDRFALGIDAFAGNYRKRRRNADAALAAVQSFLGELLAPTTASKVLNAYVLQFEGGVPITAEAANRWTLLRDLEKAVARRIAREARW